MKNRTWINMICTVLVLATFVYLFHDAVRNNRDRYDTETKYLLARKLIFKLLDIPAELGKITAV